MSTAQPIIEIRDVDKWYGAHHVLKPCSTHVGKGEIVVVCGPSGSGKSTLIKTVNALEPFQKGDVVEDSPTDAFFNDAASAAAKRFLSKILTH